MPNSYIELYDIERSSTLHPDIALIAVLECMRKNFLKKTEMSLTKKVKTFINKLRSKSLVDPVTLLEAKIAELTTRPHLFPIDEAYVNEMNNLHLPALESLVDFFPKSSTRDEVNDFFSYLKMDINAIHYNTRPSVTITPSSQELIKDVSLKYRDKTAWEDTLWLAFNKKLPKISQVALMNPKPDLLLESPINAHAKFAYEYIYQHPYPQNLKRTCHGIQHVSRVATYVPVLTNLYRKYGNSNALALTEEDIKLMQIAAIFHDSAREDDGVDRWDHESAVLLYTYLTQVLNVQEDKAKMIAEATANKDPSPVKGNFRLSETDDGNLEWHFESESLQRPPKNIYQKIIHDADCLDIIRARLAFDANYLDFYQEIAHDHPEALEEMAELITEARGLIAKQGDTFDALDEELKKRRTHDKAYADTEADIQNTDRMPILKKLGKALLPKLELQSMALLDTRPYDPAEGFSDENLAAAMRAGKIFIRGIAVPTGRSCKHDESLAALELRKTFRTTEIPTRSTKNPEASLKKMGNPSRSVTMIGYGAIPYARAGFMVINPDVNAIEMVYGEDADTGRNKKRQLHRPIEETEAALTKLHYTLKMGGIGREHGHAFKTQHNEITYHLDHYDAIYCADDSTIFDKKLNPKRDPRISRLEAVFLRYSYQQQYLQTQQAFLEKWGPEQGLKRFEKRFGKLVLLPIIHYSGLNAHITRIPEEELSEENIIMMWCSLAEEEIKMRLSNPSDSIAEDILASSNLETLKIHCMSRITFNPSMYKETRAADESYPLALRARLDAALIAIQKRALQEERAFLFQELPNVSMDNLLSTESSNLREKIFRNSSPELLNLLSEKIKQWMMSTTDIESIVHTLKRYDLPCLSKNDLATMHVWPPSSKAIAHCLNVMPLQLFTWCQALGLSDETERLRLAATALIEHQLKAFPGKCLIMFSSAFNSIQTLIQFLQLDKAYEIQLHNITKHYFLTSYKEFSVYDWFIISKKIASTLENNPELHESMANGFKLCFPDIQSIKLNEIDQFLKVHQQLNCPLPPGSILREYVSQHISSVRVRYLMMIEIGSMFSSLSKEDITLLLPRVMSRVDLDPDKWFSTIRVLMNNLEKSKHSLPPMVHTMIITQWEMIQRDLCSGYSAREIGTYISEAFKLNLPISEALTKEFGSKIKAAYLKDGLSLSNQTWYVLKEVASIYGKLPGVDHQLLTELINRLAHEPDEIKPPHL